MKVYAFLIALFISGVTFAQTTVSGSVLDDTNQSLPGASVKIVGENIGTVTDFDGNFTLTTQKALPFSLEISMMGFSTQIVEIRTNNQKVSVKLAEEQTMLNEIVVSASRTPERILESPVTIERMTLREIKNTSSGTFYDGLENLKEVHFNTSSINFKSINTRGFATIANTRFMQLVDGMDNSSPALNFVLGNLVGLSDLDVHSVELLPGASSALYGANAFNGILFMSSKSPFLFEGISAYVKRGITNHEVAGTNEYFDWGIRAAKKFTPHFAAKANVTYMRATEWIPAEYRDVNGGSIGHENNKNYDGLNMYGDEISTNIQGVGMSMAAMGIIPASAVNLLPNENVSRTGYAEKDLNDNEIRNVKADFSLHFKPWKDKEFEIIGQHKVGLGNTVYQGANRYALRNFVMQQSKIEIKDKNFFVRGYVTTEDAGNSYDMRFASWNINRLWKSDSVWFGEYAGAFIQTMLGGSVSADQAHQIARGVADTGRYLPGTPEFDNALATVRLSSDPTQGALFEDQSQIWHGDYNYNFKDLIDFAEIQLGGSYRRYVLNSSGTIFTDYDGKIRYDEYGFYGQIQKKFMDDRLKFTGSIRYDKSELFDGQFSPRVSFVYSAGETKNHNFRASFQTGFRNPTTQDLYIGLNVGPFALVGSAYDNLNRYVETIGLSGQGAALTGMPSVTFSGENAYNNAYTIPSVTAFGATGNPAELEVANINMVKPEQVKAFEVGYKGVLENGLVIDVNGYFNMYSDFMSVSRVISPLYGRVGTDLSNPDVLMGIQALVNGDRRVFQVYSNSSVDINSWGAGIGLSKKVYKDFELGANYNYAAFDFDQAKDPTFIAGFNTPEHRAKVFFGNDNLFKNFGFMINGRWWSEYEWQSSFGDGMIASTVVLDAQVSYKIPSLKSVIKLSGSNIGQNDYLQVIGAGKIGQIYMLSLTVNP